MRGGVRAGVRAGVLVRIRYRKMNCSVLIDAPRDEATGARGGHNPPNIQNDLAGDSLVSRYPRISACFPAYEWFISQPVLGLGTLIPKQKSIHAVLCLTRYGWRSKAEARPSAHPTSHCVSAFSLIMMKPLTLGACADGSGVSSGTGADRGKAVVTGVVGVQVGTSNDGQTGAGVLSTRITGAFAGRAVGSAAMGWAVGAPGRRSGEVLRGERKQTENESTEYLEEEQAQRSIKSQEGS